MTAGVGVSAPIAQRWIVGKIIQANPLDFPTGPNIMPTTKDGKIALLIQQKVALEGALKMEISKRLQYKAFLVHALKDRPIRVTQAELLAAADRKLDVDVSPEIDEATKKVVALAISAVEVKDAEEDDGVGTGGGQRDAEAQPGVRSGDPAGSKAEGSEDPGNPG